MTDPNYRQRYPQDIERAAEAYVDGMKARNLKHHPALTRAAALRAHREITEMHKREIEETHRANVARIRRELRKRSRGRRAKAVLPLVLLALCFGALAYASLVWPTVFIPGFTLIAMGAAVVCALLVAVLFFVG